MTAKKPQGFKLLTTLIVSALHPNEPKNEGTVWVPTNRMDVLEAEGLVKAKYAAEYEPAKGDTIHPTWLQVQDEQRRKEEDEEDEEDLTTDPTGSDGLSDDELSIILDGNVAHVTSELAGLERSELERLAALENARDQPRKGVNDAIADAIAAIDAQQQ